MLVDHYLSRSVNGTVREGSPSRGDEAFPGQNMVIIGDMPFIQSAVHVLQSYSNYDPRGKKKGMGEHVCMYIRMYACMYVYMYIYMYIYI